jgi:hypothetical protein
VVSGLGLILLSVTLAVRSSSMLFRKLGILMVMSAAVMVGMALSSLLY